MVNFAASTAGQLTHGDHAAVRFLLLRDRRDLLSASPSCRRRSRRPSIPQPLKTASLDIRKLYANSPVAAVGCFLIGTRQRRLRHARRGLCAADRPSDPRRRDPDGRRGPRRVADPVPARPPVRPHGPAQGPDRRSPLGAVASAASPSPSSSRATRRSSSALVVLFGAMIYPMYALAVAHANDFAAPDDFVKIAGGLLLLLGFGTMVGPILAAEAMEQFAPEGLFAFCRARPSPARALHALPHVPAAGAAPAPSARRSRACRSPRPRPRRAPSSIRAPSNRQTTSDRPENPSALNAGSTAHVVLRRTA